MPNPIRSLRRRARTALTRRQHHRSDRGASFVEYAGLIVLVAAIAVAVFATNIDDQISSAVNTQVTRILNPGAIGTAIDEDTND